MRESKTGSKGEQGSETGSEGNKTESNRVRGVRGSKGSGTYVILGFRVPTTCDKKKFDDIG